ncbi:MFS transporter [Novosphingobium aquimarinum]|uniref:MFS transporter n=1 Tax=Novosphingobium aquimarinum TaxID=2682494 RepID=UPI0012EC67A6|nr:MFS transporter [Novosphingobium aquimarinum]
MTSLSSFVAQPDVRQPVNPTKVLAAATTGNVVCVTAAVSATFGTFLVPVSEDFGWPRAAVSGVLGLMAVISAFSYPLIGRAMDKWGARNLLIGGHVALACLIMSLSLASPNMGLFYLQFAAVGLAGAVCSSPMFSKVISNWFDENRGLMMGISAGAGNGIGATLMPILAGILLPVLGWRATYLAIGAVVLAIGFPVLLAWLRDAPPTETSTPADLQGMTLAEAMRTPRFWILLVAVASGAGGMTAVFTHVVPMMTDRGFGIGEATGVVAVFALVTAGWQIVTGGLLDKVSSPVLVVPMYLAAIVGLFQLQFGHSTAAVMSAGVLLGIGMGAEYGALGYLTSRYFGLAHYGAIIGTLYGAVILAQGLTPALMDLSFDATGDYNQATIAIAVILAAGALLLFFLPSARIDQVMESEPPMASLG